MISNIKSLVFLGVGHLSFYTSMEQSICPWDWIYLDQHFSVRSDYSDPFFFFRVLYTTKEAMLN